MDESDVQELGRLRARAFGRDADIDAAGLRRLAELEARAQGEGAAVAPGEDAAVTPGEDAVAASGTPTAPGTPTTPATLAAPAGSDASVGHPGRAAASPRPPLPTRAAAAVAAEHGASGTAQPQSTTTTTVTPLPADPAASASPLTAALVWLRSRRGIALAVAAGVVLALAAAVVGVSNALSGPGRLATLAAAPEAAWPEFLFGSLREDTTVFEPYHGLLVVEVTDPWGAGSSTPCLFIAQGENEPRIHSVGCGAEQFRPTVAIEVSDNMPAELTDRHPIGSELQFVFDGDAVVVYAAG